MACAPIPGPRPNTRVSVGGSGGDGYLSPTCGESATIAGSSGVATNSPGGNAVAYGGDGGSGLSPFASGANGGSATATGGAGGSGQKGGDAFAKAGKGGDGGDTTDGGNGGFARAICGTGGDGVSCCTPPAQGQNGGTNGISQAFGGDGGNGGNGMWLLSLPGYFVVTTVQIGVAVDAGDGGNGGNATANRLKPGDGGDGIPPGRAGVPTQIGGASAGWAGVGGATRTPPPGTITMTGPPKAGAWGSSGTAFLGPVPPGIPGNPCPRIPPRGTGSSGSRNR